MDRLQWILSRVDGRCVRTACQDQAGKCSLSMERLEVADYLLLAMDGPGAPASQSRTRCDFLFFGRIPGQEHFWGCPVELTVGLRKSSRRIIEQLRAGTRLIEDLIPVDWEVRFVPIVACPFRKHRRNEYRRRTNAIAFRGRAILVHAVDCSSRMADVLASRL